MQQLEHARLRNAVLKAERRSADATLVLGHNLSDDGVIQPTGHSPGPWLGSIHNVRWCCGRESGQLLQLLEAWRTPVGIVGVSTYSAHQT